MIHKVLPILSVVLLFMACSSNTIDCVECSKNGQIIALRNIDPITGEIRNDRFKRAFIYFQYNDSKKIARISFLKKDSSYCDWAHQDFRYDSLGRLIKVAFLNADEKEIFESQNYVYNVSGQVEKIVRSDDVTPYGFFGVQVINFTYDNGNRILTESYSTFEGQPDIAGEMGTKLIEYKYDPLGQLIARIRYMTGTLAPTDTIGYRFITEYLYNDEGELTASKFKSDVNNKEYDRILYYAYDREKQVYGNGENRDSITLTHGYCDIRRVVYQELSSGYYHTDQELPQFENY